VKFCRAFFTHPEQEVGVGHKSRNTDGRPTNSTFEAWQAGNRTLKVINLVVLHVLGKEFQLETKGKLQGLRLRRRL
jgi:hypothetical protein